jgi:hypothetical protein
VEIRRTDEQVDQDLALLREVATALAVKYGDQELAARVDALGDDLNRAFIEAPPRCQHGEGVTPNGPLAETEGRRADGRTPRKGTPGPPPTITLVAPHRCRGRGPGPRRDPLGHQAVSHHRHAHRPPPSRP